MKQVTVNDLIEGRWYILYNNIEDAPFKEMFVCKFKKEREEGSSFHKSHARIGSAIWRLGAELDEGNQTAYLEHCRSWKGLDLFELSDHDVSMHVVAEVI